MNAESFRAGTGIGEASIVGLPRTHTSERVVPAETQIPARGSVLGEPWGQYAAHIVIDAQDVTKGGQRYHVVVHCSPPDWVILYGSERNRELGASVAYSQQIVPTPALGTVVEDPFVEYSPINEALSVKRTTIAPIAALNAFYQYFPSRYSFPGGLPRVLVSMNIVWHSDGSVGDFETEWEGIATGVSRSLGGSENGDAQSSASVIPELVPVIREIEASNIPSTSHFIFLPMPVTSASLLAAIAARVGTSISAWPIFKPQSASVVLKGMKVSVQARASANASYSTSDDGVTFSREKTLGKGRSFDVTPVINNVTIPPTIHGLITITNTASPSQTASGTAAVEWVGAGGLDSVDVNITASRVASGSVSPVSVAATSPSAIPTAGIYLVDSKVEPYDFGYAKVFAETIDASVFA